MHIVISTGQEAASWYGELKSWQGALGSLFGFVLLIVGALYNFRLNRRRDALLRHEEAQSTVSALYAEMTLLRRECARIARLVTNRYNDHGLGRIRGEEAFDRHFLEMLTLPEPVLYPALASKVGLLPPDLALALVSFYSDFEEVRAGIPMLLSDETRGYHYSVLVVLRPAIDAVQGVPPTLDKMASFVGKTLNAEQLDLAEAEALRSEEEEGFEQARAGRTTN
ncbi:hypothetical protein E5A73_12110 [Sphingomonas gei]|uniref:Uncharacterized protein n=1 Tax=Sphingomonas gei TaxID=1395960 RepID=A0A4S1XF51_9SPHN|nr:hypothetical protein [Sphingomonas gei]TGX53566.1 hypothetical protein E5A73_12110 [Sphingomonas gei]